MSFFDPRPTFTPLWRALFLCYVTYDAVPVFYFSPSSGIHMLCHIVLLSSFLVCYVTHDTILAPPATLLPALVCIVLYPFCPFPPFSSLWHTSFSCYVTIPFNVRAPFYSSPRCGATSLRIPFYQDGGRWSACHSLQRFLNSYSLS